MRPGGKKSFGSVRRVSWPSVHEVKLSGQAAGWQEVFRLRQEGKLALLSIEVKLS